MSVISFGLKTKQRICLQFISQKGFACLVNELYVFSVHHFCHNRLGSLLWLCLYHPRQRSPRERRSDDISFCCWSVAATGWYWMGLGRLGTFQLKMEEWRGPSISKQTNNQINVFYMTPRHHHKDKKKLY